MKIFAISDLHLSFGHNKPMEIFGEAWKDYLEKISVDWREKVSEDDVVLIAGDISWAMRLEETKEDFEFLKSLPGKKVIIRGNHDYWWSSISKVRAVLPEGVFALQNDSVDFGEFVVCGTRGWTVPERAGEQSEEDKKIFEREKIRLEMALSSARRSNSSIVCMLHYPPFNSRKDDSDFTQLLERYGVKVVVYGHLHGKSVKKDLKYVKNGISYYLTSCDQVENKLTLIEL